METPARISGRRVLQITTLLRRVAMADSTGRSRTKPEKPYPEFPLFPHANGWWAKKIRGKFYYFGPWKDPDAALQKYVDQRDDLLAGRVPRDRSVEGLEIKELCGRFRSTKKMMADTGEIALRTFQDYVNTCDRIVAFFGKHRVVEDIRPIDFEEFRKRLAKTRGPVALGGEIQRVRTVFKYAYDQELIDKPVRFGQSFRRPSRKTLRLQRQSQGIRMFEADEIRRILEHLADNHQMRAMVLLGINCGFGQSDCSNLPISALDLDKGWHSFGRPKTGVIRRCPLWPQTAEALRAVLEKRKTPKRDEDKHLVFVTKYGQRWVKTSSKGSPDDAVAKEFTKVLKALELKRPRLGFYGLRRSFETIGGESKDQVAVDYIMGHAPGDNDMAAVYRQYISDDRLQAVTDTVHKWLFDVNEVGAQATT